MIEGCAESPVESAEAIRTEFPSFYANEMKVELFAARRIAADRLNY